MTTPMDSIKGAFEDVQNLLWNPPTDKFGKDEFLQTHTINRIDEKIKHLIKNDIFSKEDKDALSDLNTELEELDKLEKSGKKINLRDPAFEKLGKKVQQLRNKILDKAKAQQKPTKASILRDQSMAGRPGILINRFLDEKSLEQLGLTEGDLKLSAEKEEESRQQLHVLSDLYICITKSLDKDPKTSKDPEQAATRKFFEGLDQASSTLEKIASFVDFMNKNSRIQSVEQLNISSIDLSRIQNLNLSLPNLKTVIVVGGSLTKVPEFISKSTKLESLDLSANLITQLPDWVANFSKLEKLTLKYNELKELPKGIDLTKLKSFSFTGNPLSEQAKKELESIERHSKSKG